MFVVAVALSAPHRLHAHACAIHTNDGRTTVSDGKPKESDSGLLGYTETRMVSTADQ
ncbi:YgdI/YgdR family lipoprotein (plasmid) [Serratia ureilytica]